MGGPEGVEWIFRNSIISRREESFYVDYVQYDDQHSWITPQSHERMGEFSIEPAVIKMVKSIHAIGIPENNATKIFADFWRKFEFIDDTHYQEFKKANYKSLEYLDSKGLLKEASEEEISLVINEYPFPLYKEKMKKKEVSIESLKKIQENWSP